MLLLLLAASVLGRLVKNIPAFDPDSYAHISLDVPWSWDIFIIPERDDHWRRNRSNEERLGQFPCRSYQPSTGLSPGEWGFFTGDERMFISFDDIVAAPANNESSKRPLIVSPSPWIDARLIPHYIPSPRKLYHDWRVTDPKAECHCTRNSSSATNIYPFILGVDDCRILNCDENDF
jgi:hypothetical protein